MGDAIAMTLNRPRSIIKDSFCMPADFSSISVILLAAADHPLCAGHLL